MIICGGRYRIQRVRSHLDGPQRKANMADCSTSGSSTYKTHDSETSLLYISCSATRRVSKNMDYSCKKSSWCKAAEKAVFVCSNEATGEEERKAWCP